MGSSFNADIEISDSGNRLPVPKIQPRLIGRSKELTQIQALIKSPHTSGIAITGLRGVGRTRLISEASRLARRGKLRVMTVRPSDALRLEPLQALGAAMGATGLHVPRTIADAAAELTRFSSQRSLFICIDDAHLLDDLSVSLVAQLAADRKCRFALSIPEEDQYFAAEFRELTKGGHLSHLPLQPLDEQEMFAICEEILGDTVEFGTAIDFSELANGNLVALRELICSALHRRALVQSRGMWVTVAPIPSSRRLIDSTRPVLFKLTSAQEYALQALALARELPLPVAKVIADASVWEQLEEKKLIIFSQETTETILLPNSLSSHVTLSEIPHLRRLRTINALLQAFRKVGTTDEVQPYLVTLWKLELKETVTLEEAMSSCANAWWKGDRHAAARLAAHSWDTYRSPHAGHVLGILDESLSRCDTRSGKVRPTFTSSASELTVRIRRDTSWQAVRALLDKGGYDSVCRFLRKPTLFDNPYQAAKVIVPGIEALLHLGRPREAFHCAQLFMAIADKDKVIGVPDFEDVSHVPALMAYAQGLSGDLRTGIEGLWRLSRKSASSQDESLMARSALLLARLMLESGRAAEAHQIFTSIHVDCAPPTAKSDIYAGTLSSALALADKSYRKKAIKEISNCPTLRSMSLDLALAEYEAQEGLEPRALERLQRTAAEARRLRAFGDLALTVHAMARFGFAKEAERFCGEWINSLESPVDKVKIRFAMAASRACPAELQSCAERFQEFGTHLYAAEAWAAAYRELMRSGYLTEARMASRRCEECRKMSSGTSPMVLKAADDTRLLSPRERQIASLVAAGLDNQEIAERLVLSRRTIENHLYRCFRKLGVRNRRELRKLFGE
ncbi:LuxR C-terminal-related transcriptional regulator [Streptomyces chartreusis]|uniref:LuxR C-terminal-related transcriptional regulator n=1 Tax=Streptomyces chartreusis TaxID=1969 RepID=UPI0036C873A2